MTGSARGTLEEPGKNVRQKAGLNRSILDTSPAAFLRQIRAGDGAVSYFVITALA